MTKTHYKKKKQQQQQRTIKQNSDVNSNQITWYIRPESKYCHQNFQKKKENWVLLVQYAIQFRAKKKIKLRKKKIILRVNNNAKESNLFFRSHFQL